MRPDEMKFNEAARAYPELMGVINRYQPDINDMVNDAVISGIDLNDPELMGAFIRKIATRIISRIKRAKRAKAKLKLSTSSGSITLSPSGIERESAAQAAQAPGIMTTATGILGNIPPALLIGVPLFLVSMMMKRKKRR